MKAPSFWNDPYSRWTKTLKPLGRIYGDIVRGRMQIKPTYVSLLPVICIGNVTMGGSGKTPVVQAIVKLLKEAGKHPAVLLRGYGGSITDTMAVDPRKHDAKAVGDEALLHAAYAPTIVSPDRVKGARVIDGDTWNTHIVMDDGLQNPALKKTLSLLVVDSTNPFGNGEIFPAGPLREAVDDAARRVDAMIIVGDKNDALTTRFGFMFPYFQARLAAINADDFKDREVTAFAGIGNPQKFFDTLKNCGAIVVDTHLYSDHHPYTDQDIRHLYDKAARNGTILVTTRKDWVRLTPVQRQGVHVLDVELMWEDKESVVAFLRSKGML